VPSEAADRVDVVLILRALTTDGLILNLMSQMGRSLIDEREQMPSLNTSF
jgi:hypothetical protein